MPGMDRVVRTGSTALTVQASSNRIGGCRGIRRLHEKLIDNRVERENQDVRGGLVEPCALGRVRGEFTKTLDFGVPLPSGGGTT